MIRLLVLLRFAFVLIPLVLVLCFGVVCLVFARVGAFGCRISNFLLHKLNPFKVNVIKR